MYDSHVEVIRFLYVRLFRHLSFRRMSLLPAEFSTGMSSSWRYEKGGKAQREDMMSVVNTNISTEKNGLFDSASSPDGECYYSNGAVKFPGMIWDVLICEDRKSMYLF